ncbi:MAG: hypothetical protein U0163_04605 [Gemmatimonadaceae bacterium]
MHLTHSVDERLESLLGSEHAGHADHHRRIGKEGGALHPLWVKAFEVDAVVAEVHVRVRHVFVIDEVSAWPRS